MSESVYRLSPFYYIHVLDNNSNFTAVEVGPKTFTRQDHQRVTFGPEKMIVVPPRHYCIISNPVIINADGTPQLDSHNHVKVRHGDLEVRFNSEPFPLYPGEKLHTRVTPLEFVPNHKALRLTALRDFTEGKRTVKAGDEWMFEGPATYYPRVDVKVVEVVNATLVAATQALKLRCKKAFTDRLGVARKMGEEYLWKQAGAYLPSVEEDVLEKISSYVLTDKKALHMRASRTFTDVYGVERKAGSEWLITRKQSETHIPDVNEEVCGQPVITLLTNRQYCVVLDPCDSNGRPQLGKKLLRVGADAFFLQPGETLENGIQSVYVLAEDQALLLQAKEKFQDGKETRTPGDRWMVYGPSDYVPPVEVQVVEVRKTIPLDENEGIYVRDVRAGKVRSVIGSTYMLKPNEELWKKELTPLVEDLLATDIGSSLENTVSSKSSARDATRVVAFRAPHNTAVQIYDYKKQEARVCFGPDLVMLKPDEQFTVLSLSGGKPKKPHGIKALALQLGPDFMTDIVIVETSDHARLSLTLSYNWHFAPDKASASDAAKIFTVPDFVGDACNTVASRVRGSVASCSFDEFHKNSAKIIRTSVFGLDAKTNKIRDAFVFETNKLVITNIDIQSVEPVDQRTRDALQRSVQLAIEITTSSQEAAARHEAARIEQEARGKLERQKIADEADAERARRELLELQSKASAVESLGQAKAEAKARAEASEIEGQNQVSQAKKRSEAKRIESESALELQKGSQDAELAHQEAVTHLELEHAAAMAKIANGRFKTQVDCVGRDTILAMASAGPAMQAKLLGDLKLSGFLVTDGNTPVNLFNTAAGLIKKE